MVLTSHRDVQLDPLVSGVPDGPVTPVMGGRLVHHRLEDPPAGVDKPRYY